MNKIDKLKELKNKIKSKVNTPKLKGFLIGIDVSMIIFLSTCPTIFSCAKRKQSLEENQAILNEYNEYIDEYCKEFSDKGFSDLDIFIKLMNDTWKSGIHYKEIADMPYGYERLFLFDNKFGDCANIADDMTAKLEKINSKYKARCLDVHLKEEDITKEPLLQKFYDNIKANHYVSIVEVNNNIILLDPTNEEIGVIKDGKIVMFDSNLELNLTPMSTYMKRGIKELTLLNETILKSYNSNDSIESLKKQYGKEAQEKSLLKVYTKDY